MTQARAIGRSAPIDRTGESVADLHEVSDHDREHQHREQQGQPEMTQRARKRIPSRLGVQDQRKRNSHAQREPENPLTISEESALTIMIEVALPGFEELKGLDFFGLTFGIDVDRDATTGNTSFWPDLHLLGPDIEIHHIESGGEILEGITHYAPDGTMTEGDASQAIWTFLDANHIQVVLSDDLVNSPSIGVGGDLFAPGVYDHFVDDGHFTFPEGEVILP